MDRYNVDNRQLDENINRYNDNFRRDMSDRNDIVGYDDDQNDIGPDFDDNDVPDNDPRDEIDMPNPTEMPDIPLNEPEKRLDSKSSKQSSSKKSFLDDIIEKVKDTTTDIQNSTENMTSKMTDAFDKYPNKMLVIGGLIFVLILCVIIAYGLYSLISYSVFNQSKIVFEQTKVPVLGHKYSKYEITNFNTTGNGKRRSYTFWMYIHDLNKYNGSYRHVFHIGDTGDIRRASPYVFLDSTENKLYFRFGALENDTFTKSYESVQNLSVSDLHEFMQQGITIPYIPIQRWVHIGVVVNENSNGGSIAAYVDGDVSKITTSGDITPGGKVVKVSNLNLDKMGSLHVGGSFESSHGPGFSGLVSKVTTYNYDLNNKDIYDDYNKGPLNGVLAKMGLGSYGLRSPIYKIA